GRNGLPLAVVKSADWSCMASCNCGTTIVLSDSKRATRVAIRVICHASGTIQPNRTHVYCGLLPNPKRNRRNVMGMKKILSVCMLAACLNTSAALAADNYKVGSTPTGMPFTYLDAKSGKIA